MMRWTDVLGCIFALTSAPLIAAAVTSAQTAAKTSKPAQAKTPVSAPTSKGVADRQPRTARMENYGDLVYAQNCSRCHGAPESLPHRVTGTVVRHMRVRANLSADDERALLRFFNPK